jgi:hypothetical protein
MDARVKPGHDEEGVGKRRKFDLILRRREAPSRRACPGLDPGMGSGLYGSIRVLRTLLTMRVKICGLVPAIHVFMV